MVPPTWIYAYRIPAQLLVKNNNGTHSVLEDWVLVKVGKTYPSDPGNDTGLIKRLSDELRALESCDITIKMPPVHGDSKLSALAELEWVREHQTGRYDDLLMVCRATTEDEARYRNALGFPIGMTRSAKQWAWLFHLMNPKLDKGLE